MSAVKQPGMPSSEVLLIRECLQLHVLITGRGSQRFLPCWHCAGLTGVCCSCTRTGVDNQGCSAGSPCPGTVYDSQAPRPAPSHPISISIPSYHHLNPHSIPSHLNVHPIPLHLNLHPTPSRAAHGVWCRPQRRHTCGCDSHSVPEHLPDPISVELLFKGSFSGSDPPALLPL